MTDSHSDNPRERLRIYVTGSCDGLAEVLGALADHEELELVGQSENVQDAAAALAGGHLEAILHATRGPAYPGDAVASIREYSRAPVILLASGDSSGLLEEALEDGVADLVPLPQLTENVVFSIRKACHQGRRTQIAEGRRGRVITVFSPKGGVGKTVVSTNLAGTLAKHMGLNTLLLDLDLQFGDAAIMLGISPEKTIYDLVVAPGELDSEKLAGYIASHPSGIDVLPAPMQPEDAELVTEGKLSRLLEVARGSYDAIIVDTSPFFHGPMLATLDRTDHLLLLCGLDVPTIKNVRLSLQTLELLSFPPDRIGVVLNRSNTNVGIQRSEVEHALETKIRADLPSDRAVPLGVNRGKPVALADPGSDFAKAIMDLAKGLVATSPTGRKQAHGRKRSMFARSKG